MAHPPMDHTPYPKIARAAASLADDWVATEKIHGAHMVVATDGTRVRFGKRKRWLVDDEPFFGWQLLRVQLSQAALNVHAHWGRAGVVRIFGELFGGAYPHRDISAVAGLSAVQTGVWYAPELRFAVFDVVVEPEGGNEAVFVAHDELTRRASAAGLATAPVLGRGTLGAMERMPVGFTTLVPGALGLPPIDGNTAEGLVIKAAGAMSVNDRPIIKRKIPMFDDAKFDESQAFDPHAHLDFDALIALAEHLVNPARIASARSKVGDDDEEMRHEVLLDVLIDLEDLLPRRMSTLTDAEDAALRAAISRCYASTVTAD